MEQQYLRDALDYIIQQLLPLQDEASIVLRNKLESLSSEISVVGTKITAIDEFLKDKKKLENY